MQTTTIEHITVVNPTDRSLSSKLSNSNSITSFLSSKVGNDAQKTRPAGPLKSQLREWRMTWRMKIWRGLLTFDLRPK